MAYNFYVSVELGAPKFNCIFGLTGKQDMEWSYAVIIRDVEWIDVKVFRDLVWAEIKNQRYRNIGISWDNTGMINVYGQEKHHLQVFSLIIQLYTFHHLRKMEYVSYDIMVRYVDNIIADRVLLPSEDMYDVVMEQIDSCLYEDRTGCVIL